MVAFAVALFLAWFGVERFVAALQEARFSPVVAAVEQGRPVPQEQLRNALDGLNSALGWYPTRDTRVGLGLLHQELATKADSAEARDAEYRAAIEQYRAGLAMAPLEPMVWTRLGWVLAVTGQDREALEAVRLSTTLAVYAPEQQWWRLELWLRLLPEVGEGDAGQLRRQLEIAFTADRARTAALAGAYGALFRVRTELETAGVPVEQLNRYFPVPITLPPSGRG